MSTVKHAKNLIAHAVHPRRIHGGSLLCNQRALGFRANEYRYQQSVVVAFQRDFHSSPTLFDELDEEKGGLSRETGEKPFYVTAPLFYPNAAPHIGHLHSLVMADIFARAAGLRGRKVELVTGSDEHGLKIQQVAAKEGCKEREVVQRGAKEFVNLSKRANVGLTRFVRTSADEGHRKGVESLWMKLQERGLLYKGKHAGWYAIADECFYTDGQTRTIQKDGEEVRIAIETGAVVEWTEEENWKFRLGSFRENLRERYEKEKTAIHPPHQHAAVLDSLVSSPLDDLSVSRPSSRLHWGFRVPGDTTQTMYVWVDALMGYLTGTGYPRWTRNEKGVLMVEDGAEVKEQKKIALCAWPPDVQVIGKDIVRFHAVHLPAFLLALDLPFPRKLYAHAHWTVSRAKMSKSVGNVVDPMALIEEYGADVVRWYIVRAGGNGRGDTDWSTAQLEKHELEIRNLLGNFLSRVGTRRILNAIPLPERRLLRDPAYLRSWKIPVPKDAHKEAEMRKGRRKLAYEMIENLKEKLEGLEKRMIGSLEKLEVGGAVGEVVEVLKLANKAYTEAVPWAATAPIGLRLSACAWAIETLRITGILLQPFIPVKAGELLDALDIGADYRLAKYARVGLGEQRHAGDADAARQDERRETAAVGNKKEKRPGAITGGVVLFPSKEVRAQRAVERDFEGEEVR